MSTIKICDRCGQIIEPFKFEPDEAWRYEVVKNCYPYPDRFKIDLCKDCKKGLIRWLGVKGGEVQE